MKLALVVVVSVTGLLACACEGAASDEPPLSSAAQLYDSAQPTGTSPASPAPSGLTTGGPWHHILVVIEENRDASHILGSADAPYLNSLARTGLDFTNMHGETHPSEPNYLALFSGSTQGLADDSCPHTYAADNLGAQLLRHQLTFAGYSESLPRTGYTGCTAGSYARKHVPWADFADLPSSVNKPLSAMPRDYARLPRVAFVIPNLQHDMHDGTVAQGDAWLRSHLDSYVTWARSHDSLLIVTWDEDEGTADNHIATIAVGAGVAPSRWTHRADHYTLLALIERTFGLPLLGGAAGTNPIPPLVGDERAVGAGPDLSRPRSLSITVGT